jgi:hypothetical protein
MCVHTFFKCFFIKSKVENLVISEISNIENNTEVKKIRRLQKIGKFVQINTVSRSKCKIKAQAQAKAQQKKQHF